MHDFLKKIFATSKPASQLITFDAVPGWLTKKESAAKADLVCATHEPMDAIRHAVAHLQIIINAISGAEHDPDIHPKLKSIAKNSLPQYIRAMKSALAKDLPDDPEEFYTAAAECVNSCLHSTHGQGRYLQAIFPEEMKAVRQGIDGIGRGINTINPLLAAYRKEMADVASARVLFAAIIDLNADFDTSEEKVKRGHMRIAEIEERRVAIEKERDSMLQDPRMTEIDEQKAALADLARQRDEAVRIYSALSMTASHVFRKAEKIAIKQRHPSESVVLNTAMMILSDHELPDRSQLESALTAASPITVRMIADGEVSLKNKEERAVFSDIPRFRSDICTASSSLHALEENCRYAEMRLSAHPLLLKMQSLEREKTQLAAMLDKEKHALTVLAEWRSKTEGRIPELLHDLRKIIAGISGDNVQLQINDQTPS